MKLTYHQKVFDLLKRTPTFDPTAEAKLRTVEDAYGLILPPSVREWYSLNEAISILQESDDCSDFVTLKEMVENAPRWFAKKWLHDDRDIPEYEHPTIPFSWDHCAGIGVSALAIKGNDDPYVVTYVDETEWWSSNETFSESILRWRYNELYTNKSEGFQAYTDKALLSEKDYQTINHYFTEMPSIPPIRIFEYDDQLIYSWYKWDKQSENTYLWLHADTAQSYRDLLQRFWTIGNLATALYTRGNRESESIFEEFRPRKVRNPSKDKPQP